VTSKFPMRLDSFFFVSQSVEADAGHNKEQPTNVVHKTKASVHPAEREHHYYAMVFLEVNEEESSNIDYRYKFTIFGAFDVDQSIPQTAAIGMVRDLGVSLLIGAIRERLATLTATGPWPVQYMDFIPMTDIQGLGITNTSS
jgi:hypothetical protein